MLKDVSSSTSLCSALTKSQSDETRIVRRIITATTACMNAARVKVNWVTKRVLRSNGTANRLKMSSFLDTLITWVKSSEPSAHDS
jgi:hypothetical protein